MKLVTLNTEEKENLIKTLNVVLDDLREIWKSSPLVEAYINFPMRGVQEYDGDITTMNWKLYISKTRIIIINPVEYKESIYDNYESIKLEEIVDEPQKKFWSPNAYILKHVVQRNPLDSTKTQNRVFHFLTEYDGIREKLIEVIKEGQTDKDEVNKKLDAIRTRYSNEVCLDLDLPPTQNLHEIELVEEEGKQVGIINFGSKIIKIITDGNIVLTKREKNKTKVK